MEQEATRLLSERPGEPRPPQLADVLGALLELTRNFRSSLENGAARDDEAFSATAFLAIQAGCRLTGADGASLYSSKRQGYLDRQAFCWDPNLSFEQMRTTSQVAEHVEVGDGIAGFIALDAAARAAAGYEFGCPIRAGSAAEVWDVPRVDELPEKLRHRTTQLLREGAIDIGSMYLVKGIGSDGTDFVLQLIRKRSNGEFSVAQKLVAEVLAELIFPQFRNLETFRGEAAQPVAPGLAAEPSAAIRQIAADAYEAIRAIAGAAMARIDTTAGSRK